MGATEIGPNASRLLDFDDPEINWVFLVRAFGVDALRADTMDAFSSELDVGFATQGP